VRKNNALNTGGRRCVTGLRASHVPCHAGPIDGETVEFDDVVAASRLETLDAFIEERFAILSVLYQHVGVAMGHEGVEEGVVEHGLDEGAEGGRGADGYEAQLGWGHDGNGRVRCAHNARETCLHCFLQVREGEVRECGHRLECSPVMRALPVWELATSGARGNEHRRARGEFGLNVRWTFLAHYSSLPFASVMATPFKHFCSQTARPHISPFRTKRSDPSQWYQPGRRFSYTPSPYLASPAPGADDNPYIKPFPGSNDAASHLDPAYEDDDLSSLAHKELDQHRELREMVRVAAWEMPLLGRLHKPYQRDAKSILRWRYTTYMGELHPAANKVVVEFKPADLGELTEAQTMKLVKLAGPRYNTVTGTVRMSCESFETQAMNKRYLGDVIGNLITEAKDPSADSFEDVPLDTRHMKIKRQPRFPEEWLMTEERQAKLEQKRRQALLSEGRRVEEQKMVSGEAAIEEAQRIKSKDNLKQPIMVEARMPRANGKMRQRDPAENEANKS